MPRPDVFKRFSGAKGSGIFSGSRPLPWSRMVMIRSSPVRLKRQPHLLAGIVGVAVQDGVDGGLAHGHGNPHDLVIVEARFGRDSAGCLLGAVDGLQRRIQRIGDPLFGHGKKFMSTVFEPDSEPETSPSDASGHRDCLTVTGKPCVSANAVVCPSAVQMSTRESASALSAAITASVSAFGGPGKKACMDSSALLEYSRYYAEFCADRTAGHAGT